MKNPSDVSQKCVLVALLKKQDLEITVSTDSESDYIKKIFVTCHKGMASSVSCRQLQYIVRNIL